MNTSRSSYEEPSRGRLRGCCDLILVQQRQYWRISKTVVANHLRNTREYLQPMVPRNVYLRRTASSSSYGRFVAARIITLAVESVLNPSQSCMNSVFIVVVASCSCSRLRPKRESTSSAPNAEMTACHNKIEGHPDMISIPSCGCSEIKALQLPSPVATVLAFNPLYSLF